MTLFDDRDPADGDLALDDASDREILYRIWADGEIGDLPRDEAWGELVRRYPGDPRLALAALAAGFSQPGIPGVVDAGYVLGVARRLVEHDPTLRPSVADLLEVARGELGTIGPRDRSAWDALVRGVAPDGVADGAAERLAAFERGLLRELHDRTLGGRPIAG